MFFGKVSRQNRLDAASREPAHRAPTGLGETVSTAFNEVVGNELSISFIRDRNAARRELLDKIRESSGLELRHQGGAKEQDNDLRERYEKFRLENPDAPAFPLTKENTDAIMRQRRQDRRDASARAELGEQGFVQGAFRFGASTAGYLADPINILSMGVAGTGRSVLSTAIRQAGIGVGAEIPIQGLVQTQRTQIGEQASLGEAAFAIGSAGLGAGVLGGAASAVGRGLKRVLSTRELTEAADRLPPEFRTQEVKDAQRVLQYLDEIEKRNPFPDTPTGRAAHQDRLQKVYQALSEGRPLDEAFDAPFVQRTETVVSKRGEPVSDFLSRVEKTDPELFAQVKKVDGDVVRVRKELDDALETIDSVDPQVIAAGAEAAKINADLKAAKKSKADRRKIKKLEGKNKEAQAELKAGRAAERKLKTAQKKAASAQKRLDTLLSRQDKLNKKADARINKVDPFSQTIRETREALDKMPDLPEGVKDLADFGRVIRALAMSRSSRTDVSTPVGQQARAMDDIIENAEAEDSNVIELMETQVKELSEVDETTTFSVDDGEGGVRQVTAKEMLEDIREDKKLVSELGKCLAGVLT